MGFGKTDLALALLVLLSAGIFLALVMVPTPATEKNISDSQPASEQEAKPTLRHIQKPPLFPHASDGSDPYDAIPVPPDDPDTSNYSTNVPAAVLIAPYYTSNSSAGFSTQNTRISLTNTGTSTEFLHVFLVSSGCSPADLFICLTSRQTVHFYASDYDPDSTGYIVVIPTDSDGLAVGHNTLIGDVAFKTASGFSGGYNLVGFRSINGSMGTNTSVAGNLTFDGSSLERWPDMVILPEFPSLADNNSNRLVLVSVRGDLGVSPNGTSVNYTGTAYNETPSSLAFTFNGNSCFMQSDFANGTFPNVTGGINAMVPSGQSGWLKISKSGSAIPLLGLYMSRNPNLLTTNDAYNGARVLPGTCPSGSCPSYSLAYPIFPVFC
jgi:hypothetical protein